MKKAEMRVLLRDLIDYAVGQARESNARIAEISPPGSRPAIRRVFIFDTINGYDWGTTREEFGQVEPILSVPLDEKTPI